MESRKWIDDLLPDTVASLAKCWQCPIGANTEKGLNLAGQQAVHKVAEDLMGILFPGCHGHEPIPEAKLSDHLYERLRVTMLTLKGQIKQALEYQCTVDHGKECKQCSDCEEKAEATVSNLVESLPEVQKVLQHDIVAGYEGDPAAKSTMEVVMSYPGVFALIVHRIAHVLYRQEIPLVPRVMSEYAHSRTGIDVHPGAEIGPGFFMDHGTGIVIGETSVIGEKVKLYQGVTLGALSFEKDDEGNPVKGVKRHPNVQDHVVIYGGATILGNVTIGAHSEVGGNVWLTHSVPPHSKVYNQEARPLVRRADGTWHTKDGPWNDTGAGI